ncbi:MAG: hypothetical protein GY943_06930 [Chloroflexi bacterium]|nr:hypothetical protein [Chloroflexota bacterium]
MNQTQTRSHRLQFQIDKINGRLITLQHKSDQLSKLRLFLFLLGAVVSGTVFLTRGAWPWVGATLLAMQPFVVAVVVHRRIETAVSQFTIWRNIKQTHLARLTLDWEQIPQTLPVLSRFEHPFALDVDLIGERSLHQLLDTAVSAEGSERLRSWLTDIRPERNQMHVRQAQIQVLSGIPQFRDKLTLYATLATDENEEKWAGQQLLDWLQKEEPAEGIRPLLLILSGLALIHVPLFVLDMAGVMGAWWLLPWIVYAGLFMIRGGDEVGDLFKDATFLDDRLRTLNGVFHYLEKSRFVKRPFIQELCAPLLAGEERPSQHIKRVRRVVAGVGVRQNPFLGMLLNMTVPWDVYFAYRLRQCRQDLAAHLPIWLDIWFELEALSALATYADLNQPHVSFPTISPVLVDDKPLFAATELGHPLIPVSQRVCNAFEIPSIGSMTLITGSNMAGKSSFLRTIGINLSLAYAGGPVVAHSLQTILFRFYSSIQVNDSVIDGFSFFYAEVRRLQALLAALKEEDKRPLLFLIDEIFRGTNNRERLIGSRAYIRALLNEFGVGAIATHDLELVQLADEVPTIRNMHFRDDVQDGKMVFDYLLHEGPCPTTNALKIMALAGLPVDSIN